ncbi:MAG: ATP F0F1 synthase subunit B [Devosia sp.]|nr:ATP F0F1 synthase subunit B [Devosia sp.]
MSFGLDATTAATIWVFIGLVIFLAIALYLGVHKTIARTLDNRIRQVEQELAEATRLREEAKALLESYAGKRQQAEAEAKALVAAAHEEAARLAGEAATALEALITRRTKAVEDKIAQAEQQAVAEVRGRSADIAVEAARVLLTQQMTIKGDALVEQAIKDVAAKLN